MMKSINEIYAVKTQHGYLVLNADDGKPCNSLNTDIQPLHSNSTGMYFGLTDVINLGILVENWNYCHNKTGVIRENNKICI